MAVVFVICLFIFGATTIIDVFDGPDTPREEFVAQTPQLDFSLASIARFPGDFRYYIKRRFEFKETLVTLNSTIMRNLFGVSPYFNVIQGKDDFLFLGAAEAVDFSQGNALFDEEELNYWQLSIDAHARHIQSLGSRYELVLTPNKHTVYSDKLPGWFNIDKVGKTRADQLLQRSRRDGLPVHDLRSVISQQRNNSAGAILYYKTDTHWNEYGASIGVNHLLSQIGVKNQTAVRPQLMKADKAGDLARMIGIQGHMTETPWSVAFSHPPVCRSRNGDDFIRNQTDPLRFNRLHCVNSYAPDTRAVVFIDSFGVSMVPAFAAAFREVTFLWQYKIDYSIVEEMQPDFVIHQITERKLQTLDPGSF